MYVVFIICVYIYQISLYKHTQKAEMKMAEGIFRHAASCVMQIYGGWFIFLHKGHALSVRRASKQTIGTDSWVQRLLQCEFSLTEEVHGCPFALLTARPSLLLANYIIL